MGASPGIVSVPVSRLGLLAENLNLNLQSSGFMLKRHASVLASNADALYAPYTLQVHPFFPASCHQHAPTYSTVCIKVLLILPLCLRVQHTEFWSGKVLSHGALPPSPLLEEWQARRLPREKRVRRAFSRSASRPASFTTTSSGAGSKRRQWNSDTGNRRRTSRAVALLISASLWVLARWTLLQPRVPVA